MSDDNRNPNALLEHLSTAVMGLDRAFRVRYLNPAGEALFGVSARRLLGQPFTSLAPDAAKLEPGMRHAMTHHASYTERERSISLGPQRTITVDITVTPLDDGILLELVQLDRRLKIGREHHLLSQNRAIRELVRGLAHEIKNPLGGLRGAAQLLEAELENDELIEYTQVIIGEANRLRNLVDNLLGPNRLARPEPTNIHEVLERVRHLVRAEAPPGVRLHRDFDPSIPPLRAEPDKLIQAVLNIVSNAVQALDGEGNVTLRTRTQRNFTIDDTLHRLVVRLDVIDDGPGVPPDLREAIFYPMVTTRAQGSGLGLPLAQTLVHQSGGLIECHSEPGRTVFTLWLPLEDAHER